MKTTTIESERRPLPAEKGQEIPVSENDSRRIEELYSAFRRSNAKLISPDGATNSLPGSLYSFLVELTALLNESRAVMIVQNHVQLSTIEAANLLGVSRQFLVHLLEKGDIPYHLVGTHRRIYAQDLFRYKAARDKSRQKLLRDLAVAEAEEGIYGSPPPAVDAS
jgi:excisionase family DNA binding protein